MIDNCVTEVIFVGLPGPTHHYSGLSPDNVASGLNRGSVSNPRLAALQALELVRLLKRLGVEAAILPPQLRPHMPLLRQRFKGDDAAVMAQAAEEAPEWLEKASSAAAMWTANAATVTPGADATDGKLHITTANLHTNVHRRIEAMDTYHTLKAIFAQVPDCVVHPPLPELLRDEGAANHMRLSPGHSASGLHVFVYGADGSGDDPQSARQTLAASKAIAAQHCLLPLQTLFVKQNPDVIRQGVFHNDVIAVSNGHVLLAHAEAYAGGRGDIECVAAASHTLYPRKEPVMIIVSADELSVEEAVHSYIFNSQIITKPDGAMAVIAPSEAQTLYGGKAAKLLERIRADDRNPINEMHYADLRQSMRNGGGPACLRLRVPVTGTQLAALRNTNVLADEALLERVTRIVETYYPDTLFSSDLGNPELYRDGKAMLAELAETMR